MHYQTKELTMEREIRELFNEFDTDTLVVSAMEIDVNGTNVDFLILDPNGNILIWAGSHPSDEDDMDGEELLPSDSERESIYKQVIDLI